VEVEVALEAISSIIMNFLVMEVLGLVQLAVDMRRGLEVCNIRSIHNINNHNSNRSRIIPGVNHNIETIRGKN
jgi:hypothetical protein